MKVPVKMMVPSACFCLLFRDVRCTRNRNTNPQSRVGSEFGTAFRMERSSIFHTEKDGLSKSRLETNKIIHSISSYSNSQLPSNESTLRIESDVNIFSSESKKFVESYKFDTRFSEEEKSDWIAWNQFLNENADFACHL
jgi:hypothetical protein